MPFIYYPESGSFHASRTIICTGAGDGCGKMIKVEIDGAGTETEARTAWSTATDAARDLSAKLGWDSEGRCPAHQKAAG